MKKILISIIFFLSNNGTAFSDIVNPDKTNLISNFPGLISIFIIVILIAYSINSSKKKKDDE